MQEEKQYKKKKFRFPNAFIIIAILMIFFVIVSWIAVAAKASYIDTKGIKHYIHGMGITDIFPAIWSGFQQRAAIILFVFSIGGLLCVLNRSKILDAGIDSLTRKMNGKEILLIPILMLLFGLGGTTYGMWEETLAFFPIIIPIFIKAKYGPLTGVFVILLGSGIGCLASTINPFAIGLAFHGGAYAGAKQGTHMILRWIIWVIYMIPGILFVMWYAKRNKRTNLEKSYLSSKNRKSIRIKFRSDTSKVIEFTLRRKISLFIFLFGFIIMIFTYLPWESFIGTNNINSINTWFNQYFFWFATNRSASGSFQSWAAFGSWYFISVAGVFLINTIIIFLINFKDYTKPSKEEIKEENTIGTDQRFINTYFEGVTWMIPVCMLIAFASGLGVILTLSGIGPWIASSASSLGNVGLIGFAVIIFLLSLALSILVPSTSGFAAAFIPIFAGLAIKAFPHESIPAVNIVVIAFILANGLANLFTPTSAPLMAYTSFALVQYKTWIKSTWKFTLFLGVLSILIMVLCGAMLPYISF